MQTRLLALGLSLLCACSGSPERAVDPAGRENPGQTLVYECGEDEFVVRTLAGGVALYLPDEYRELKREKSGSGERYSAGDITFWSKGDSAMLDVGKRRYRDCWLNRERGPWEEARARGVDFRAVGQEPGWHLEIQHEGEILLVADYGARTVLLPTPEPELLDTGERYLASDDRHRLEVQIETRHCTDSMSGAVYDNRVLVTLDGKLYTGCGTALEQW